MSCNDVMVRRMRRRMHHEWSVAMLATMALVMVRKCVAL